MAERGITIYVVPTSDFHESEYVGDYFKARKFITGLQAPQEPQSLQWIRQVYGRMEDILFKLPLN